MLFDDVTIRNKCFGNADGHLSVVGVPDFVAGISDQLLDRRETSTDGASALRLELTAERVADGEAEEAPLETILEGGFSDCHQTCPIALFARRGRQRTGECSLRQSISTTSGVDLGAGSSVVVERQGQYDGLTGLNLAPIHERGTVDDRLKLRRAPPSEVV